MKKTLAALATLVLLAVPAVQADEHLVSPGTAQQQLLDAAGTRERNVAAVEAFVDSAQGSAALAAVGLDASRVRAQIGTLSDSELQEVAARASALDADPVAGLPFTQNRVVWIAAIAVALIILIVLIA